MTRIADNESWYYQGYTKCNISTRYEGNSYVCKQRHISSQMIHRYALCTAILLNKICHILSISITYTINRYKICLYGTDSTCELEFMLFDDRATYLIGKTAEKLLTQNNKSNLPPEIAAIVGEKLTVIVKVFPGKSIHRRGPNKDNKDPTFDILNIKKRHGKDVLPSISKNQEDTAVLATTSSELRKLPPLVPIEPKRQEIQVQFSIHTSFL